MLDPKRDLFRWGPISACPLFMHYTIKTSFAPMKDLFDECYPYSHVIFHNNKVTWLLDMEQFGEASRNFTEKNILIEKRLRRYNKIWKERTDLISSKFSKLSKIFPLDTSDTLNDSDSPNYDNIPFEDLLRLFEEFTTTYYDWWTCTMSVELVTVTIEKQLSEALKKHYIDRDEREFNKDYAILSSPLELTFYRKEQLDLLSLLGLQSNEKESKLQQHRNKYYWILNGYLESKVLDIEYFRKGLSEYEYNLEDSKRLQKEIKTYSRKILKDKQKILDKLPKDDNLIRLIKLVEDFSIAQDRRKALNFKADHYLEVFAKEFSNRSDYSIDDIKMSLPDEIIFAKLNLKRELIKKRKKCFVLNCSDKKIEKLNGKDAEKIQIMFEKPKDLEQSVLHGILASSGNTHYFRGTAKIIHTVNELDKLEGGEILVTTMTSPDFVVGMKRAGAIITDSGGMLCHAAIVSREFGKPCIVGTEVGTKVIKDGDIVELHCARGTVKIIKS